VTIEDQISPQDIAVGNRDEYNKTCSLNRDKIGFVDESIFTKGSYKNNHRLSELVVSLAKDLGVSEEKAYQTLISKNGSIKQTLKSRISTLYSPTNDNMNTLCSIIQQKQKHRKRLKRRKSMLLI